MSIVPLPEQWYKTATRWATLESAASILEESKSAFLSQLMTSHGDIPVSKAELKSKATDQWKSYLQAMVDARTKANLAKIEMEFLKLKIFEENSRAATERVQARL